MEAPFQNSIKQPDLTAVTLSPWEEFLARLRVKWVVLRTGIEELKIELKYNEGEPVISEIMRVSKPGRRVYAKIKDLPKVYNGLGISILSTPRGVMSDHEARQANVGGEVLCQIF